MNKANSIDTEDLFLDKNISISNDAITFSIYEKREDVAFELLSVPDSDGNVPSATSYGIYISAYWCLFFFFFFFFFCYFFVFVCCCFFFQNI